MGRQSRVKAAHVKNIQEARERHKASVEDITATEDPDFVQNTAQNATNDHLEQGFFILEEDLGPNTDDDEDEEEAGNLNIKTDADIFTFSQILAEVQLAAVKAEQEATQEWPIKSNTTLGMHHKPNITMPKSEGNRLRLNNNLFSPFS